MFLKRCATFKGGIFIFAHKSVFMLIVSIAENSRYTYYIDNLCRFGTKDAIIQLIHFLFNLNLDSNLILRCHSEHVDKLQ